MGLMNILTGTASEVDEQAVAEEIRPMLADGESLVKAYKIVRDMYLFTDRRLILIDKQGLTGKKTEFVSIPYRSIALFSKESAGFMDVDAELKIWVRGLPQPIVKEFRKDRHVNDVYRLLAQYACG